MKFIYGLRRLWTFVPSGGSLPEAVWRRRRDFLVGLTWLHAVVLARFQDWTPYLLAVAFVTVHHGIVGVWWPQAVYNHPAAINAPWTWAGIHAAFVLWSCLGSVIAWRFNEVSSNRATLILEAT